MANACKKEKSQSFVDFGIPVGSILVFKKDPAVMVKTLDGKNKVEYMGKPYSISTLAKQLVGSPVSGYRYFKFEGKILKSPTKREAKPITPESAESPAPPPAEEGVEAPDVSAESDEVEDTGESERDIDPLARGVEVDALESTSNEAEVGA
jgi:hypothetical protein